MLAHTTGTALYWMIAALAGPTYDLHLSSPRAAPSLTLGTLLQSSQSLLKLLGLLHAALVLKKPQPDPDELSGNGSRVWLKLALDNPFGEVRE